MAEAVKTYRGYDNKNQCIVTYTANDANTYINPTEVANAVQKVQDIASTDFPPIASKLTDISNSDAIVIDGTKMTEIVEQIIEAVKTYPSQLADSLTELVSKAESEHDRIQKEMNDAAYSACKGTAGVVSVS